VSATHTTSFAVPSATTIGENHSGEPGEATGDRRHPRAAAPAQAMSFAGVAHRPWRIFATASNALSGLKLAAQLLPAANQIPSIQTDHRNHRGYAREDSNEPDRSKPAAPPQRAGHDKDQRTHHRRIAITMPRAIGISVIVSLAIPDSAEWGESIGIWRGSIPRRRRRATVSQLGHRRLTCDPTGKTPVPQRVVRQSVNHGRWHHERGPDRAGPPPVPCVVRYSSYRTPTNQDNRPTPKAR